MPETIQMEERDGRYVLIRESEDGKIAEFSLSPDSVLKLARSSLALTDQILAQRTPSANFSPAVVTPVAQISLNKDVHGSEVHLEFFDPNGMKAVFALPLKMAKSLADRLPGFVAEIEASRPPTRQ